MKDYLCTVISNQELQAGYYRLVLEKPFDSFQPGQFCMLRILGLTETLLRRPFSLCQEDAKYFEIVYKAVGAFTWAMARLTKGQRVQVLAPLGTGLDWSGYSRVVGIAGGYGIAPMLGLGRHLKKQGVAYEVYYGARAKADLLLQDDFKKAGIPLHISTEDGSEGYRGRVTDLIKPGEQNNGTQWFVCGPQGLLRAAASLARDYSVDCQVSMEEYMGCGMGVCLGCVVKTCAGDYVRSCVEGPVMDARAVQW